MSTYGDPDHRTVPPPPSTPPTPPPSGGQPAWAWWVVGIVIPVIGIAVTLLTVNDRDSDDDSEARNTARTPTASTGAPGQEGAGDSDSGSDSGSTEEAEPLAPAFGPADWSARGDYGNGQYLELDSAQLQAFDQITDGTDLALDATAIEPVDAEGTVALLPAGTADPTEAECRTQIEKNKLDEVDLTPGTRFCVQTGEGRTAFLRVLSAPVEGEGTVRFKVTVWPLPQ
ncbi:hypothetical protein [Streptomyces sp. G1]|uniref:hypothetical protein n=1 Tax=Streptomyces sp. G1 TaxID=361572 RepID=UPI00202EDC84|nr:hypothetical protein [Streptomyces sp. G1]MCM1977156.1 hypothetical protein [Streptomyces sp. G1]